MTTPTRLRLLYLVSEPWPTHRADVRVLFGKYLPRLGISTDLVTDADSTANGIGEHWTGGEAMFSTMPRGRASQYTSKMWHFIRVLARLDRDRVDAVQVRDMPVVALIAWVASKWKRLPFFYWMSFPLSELAIDRARARGPRAGMRYWFPLIQGHLGKWLLYRVVLRRADHVFVQSGQMASDVAKHGIDRQRMTPVLMGVDLEVADINGIAPIDDGRLDGKRVVLYLGTLDRARQIEILFEMLAIARANEPDLVLVLVGDTEDPEHKAWLALQAERLGVADSVIWTGWVPTDIGWRYVRAAEVGLSPFPRGFLLDSASPTKAIEYMALGLPVIANDNPDQASTIRESGAGICVDLNAEAFATALVDLLRNPNLRREMADRGRSFVPRSRGYDTISRRLASVYEGLLAPRRD